MAQTTDDNRTSRTKGRRDEGTKDDLGQWPWPVQFVALLIVLALATFLIVLPVLVVRVLDAQYAFSSETDLWTAMIAILLGLTTMTVSGIFVFMTFRIDRGARLEAQRTAKKETNKAMEDYGKDVVDKLIDELKAQFNDSKCKINDLYSNVRTDVSKVAEKTKTDMSRLAEKTKADVSKVADKAKTDMSRLADTVKRDVSQLADKVEEDVSRLADTSVNVVETQVKESDKRIRAKFDDGMREIGELFETAREKAQAAIERAGETPDDGAGGSNEE